MRLDKFLKVSRLIKRRTVANEACDAEKVSVNGKPARASYDVKVGDEIEINMGKSRLKSVFLRWSRWSARTEPQTFTKWYKHNTDIPRILFIMR